MGTGGGQITLVSFHWLDFIGRVLRTASCSGRWFVVDRFAIDLFAIGSVASSLVPIP